VFAFASPGLQAEEFKSCPMPPILEGEIRGPDLNPGASRSGAGVPRESFGLTLFDF